jgi:hypothetical protein
MKTTIEPNTPNSAPARLNPNRSEFTYRYVRLHAVEDYCRMGYMPLPDVLIGYVYEFDSMSMEWMCDCKEPMLNE